MPRSIDTESNDANMRQQTFSNDKHELTNSEACSILNQRLPNSLHHDNALLSNLFINGTHLRTEPCGSAWHSRHERTTRHIPAPEDCSARKRRQFTRTWRDAKAQKVGQSENRLSASFSPLLVKNTPTARKNLQRTSAKPLPQRRLLTSASYLQPTMYRKHLSNPRARFDHTGC